MRPLKILDFDIENRPLAYLGSDFTTGEITAIAACWHGEPDTMAVWLLGDVPLEKMLESFRDMYDQADMVTGHFIRGYDLPVISGALIEMGLPPLMSKLTCDTKIDLVKHKYLSASQENLCEVLGIAKPKIHMSNAHWREANRLTKEGLKLTYARCAGDVLQHMDLRTELVNRGLLKSPRVWRP